MARSKRKPVDDLDGKRKSTGQGPGLAGKESKAPDKPRQPLWRKPLTWLGGVATLVVAGVLANVLSSQAQRIVPPSAAGPSAGTAVSAPLRVVSIDPVDPDTFGVVAFRNKLVLNSSALHQISLNPLPSYLYKIGGYPAFLDTQLVVRNTRNYTVQIINAYVLKSCTKPLSGTLFYAPPQGAVENIQLGFNLDSADTEARVASGANIEANAPDYFSKYTVSIGPGALQVFNIVAETARYACTLRYDFVMIDGTRKVQQVIAPDNGNGWEFRVAALLQGTNSYPFQPYATLYVAGNFGVAGDLDGYAAADPRKFSF